MVNNFKFKINNFGPINNADINLNKLNVVGGVNASGKSFSSRLLFCIVTALSEEGKKHDNNSVKKLFIDIIKRFELLLPDTSSSYINDEKSNLIIKLNQLFDSWDDYNVSHEFLNDFYTNFLNAMDEFDFNYHDFEKDLNKINSIIDLHLNKFEYIIPVLRFLLVSEFGLGQLNTFKGSSVNISMNSLDCKMEYDIQFTSDALKISTDDENQVSCVDFNNVIYIDSPSVMDFHLTGNHIHHHYISLYESLTHNNDNVKLGVYDNVNEIVDINKKFNKMINGSFKFNKLDNSFLFESDGQTFDVKNIASGYKQIGVLMSLLNNNQINSKTFLILDEPEINLHPSFQIKLANIIVKLVKELDLMVYINSHSPFIIEALEVYSKKEGIEDNTNFFMCENIDDNDNKFNIKQIEREDLKILYDNLSNPFRMINNIRFENELNDLD